MASYQELYDLRSNTDFSNKIAVAVVVKAQALISGGTPTTDELTWASKALSNPHTKAQELWGYVVAANKNATIQQIIDATDTAIQTNVDEAADALIAGGIV